MISVDGWFEAASHVWVCELVPPATAALERGPKMDIYARVGVKHLWLVDAAIKMLEIWRLEGSRWLRIAAHFGSEKVRAEPFEAAEIDLSRWWLEE